MIKTLIHLILFFVLILSSMMSRANNDSQETIAKTAIIKLYSDLNKMPSLSMPERLDMISAQFLNKPYLLGALGEGHQARYDQSPRYRIDGFDCETFVDTVLGIALTNHFEGFEHCIQQVRYQQGKAEFITRNHFTDLDWNLNNQRQGYLKDITSTFIDQDHRSVAQIAKAVIDKPSWYQHFDVSKIKLIHGTEQEQIKRLKELKSQGKHLPIRIAQIAYIPLTALFDQDGQANQILFDQIPNGAIIEIIRPNWQLKQQIGTCLNVSHLGFVFRKPKQLLFRQASSEYHQVIDVSLIDYLRKARQSPTIKGINVQIVLPNKPYIDKCWAKTLS